MAEVLIGVEVVYASVDAQCLIQVQVPVGTTLRGALVASGIDQQFAALDLARCPVGVFGKVVSDPESRAVQQGDRIEIYRPLLADPMEVRRLRAAKAAQAKKAEKPI